MKENRLVEIPTADLLKLRDLYKDRKVEPSSYNAIQNFVNWFQKDPFLGFAKVYSLNGDWSDGTFVIRELNNRIIFNTLSDSEDRLLAALNCLDTNAPYLFTAVSQRMYPTLDRYFKQFLRVRTTPIMTIWYHIPKEEALKFDSGIPQGITLSPLRQEHVDTVNSSWPHRDPGSVDFVSRLISMNPTIGAFDHEGNLFGWIFQMPTGALGILHVKDEYKRKGYGSLLVRLMSKKFAEMGIEVTAPVVHTNSASRNLFKKLNFKEIDKVFWRAKPAQC